MNTPKTEHQQDSGARNESQASLPPAAGSPLMPPEPTAEIIRVMLHVVHGNMYRDGLMHPNDGPNTRKRIAKDIEIARRQYQALREHLLANSD